MRFKKIKIIEIETLNPYQGSVKLFSIYPQVSPEVIIVKPLCGYLMFKHLFHNPERIKHE